MSSSVSDTGPPLHLAEIGQERALSVFASICITMQVKAELTRHDVFERIAATLGDGLHEESVSPDEVDAARIALSGYSLHPADFSVAALTWRVKPDVVLTDDLSLRKALESQGHLVAGSAGILIRAFRIGRLAWDELQLALDQLFAGSTLYLSPAFRSHVRRLLEDLGASRSVSQTG